jgi:hypothetical protein
MYSSFFANVGKDAGARGRSSTVDQRALSTFGNLIRGKLGDIHDKQESRGDGGRGPLTTAGDLNSRRPSRPFFPKQGIRPTSRLPLSRKCKIHTVITTRLCPHNHTAPYLVSITYGLPVDKIRPPPFVRRTNSESYYHLRAAITLPSNALFPIERTPAHETTLRFFITNPHTYNHRHPRPQSAKVKSTCLPSSKCLSPRTAKKFQPTPRFL